MDFDPDICRSLLFVPAGNERYLESALRGGADVIQIDLEDAIPSDQKDHASQAAKGAIDRLHDAGRVGTVRINNHPSRMSHDLEAVVGPKLAGLTIPKVATAEDLQRVDELVSQLEQDRQIPAGQIRLVAQIESAAGILNARQIAGATPRLAALGIGMEDLATELGSDLDADALYFPNMLVLYAAREAGLAPIGYLGSISVYNDATLFDGWIRRAKSLGFEGGFCIHPNQVEILNSRFAPAEHEVEEARSLIELFEAASSRGSGVISYQGRMVDKPMVDRARRTLKRHEILSGR